MRSVKDESESKIRTSYEILGTLMTLSLISVLVVPSLRRTRRLERELGGTLSVILMVSLSQVRPGQGQVSKFQLSSRVRGARAFLRSICIDLNYVLRDHGMRPFLEKPCALCRCVPVLRDCTQTAPDN